MDNGNVMALLTLSLVFGAGVLITVSIFWYDHRTRTRALDVLRVYAERGEEPPPAVIQALTAVSGRQAGVQPHCGPTGAQPQARARHLAHAAANAVAAAGLGFLWWRASQIGETGALVALIAFVVGLFFAASFAARIVGAYYAPDR